MMLIRLIASVIKNVCFLAVVVFVLIVSSILPKDAVK